MLASYVGVCSDARVYVWYPPDTPTFPMYIQLEGVLLLYEVLIGPFSTWEKFGLRGTFDCYNILFSLCF